MRKLLPLLLCVAAFGQNPSPQPNFATQEFLASPSLVLNFNDYTSAFKDQVSGATFSGVGLEPPLVGNTCVNTPASSYTSTNCTLSANAGDTLLAYIVVGSSFTTITDSQGATAVAISGASSSAFGVYAYYFSSVGSGSHTITVNFSASASYQVLQVIDVQHAGVIDTASVNTSSASTSSWTSGSLTTTVPNDLLVGFAELNVSSYTFTAPVFTALSGGGWTGIFPAYYSAATAGSYAFTGNASLSGYASALVAFKPATVSSGSVTVRQPGFDSTQVNNTSAGFPYNGFNVAPNNTEGAIDWNSPWTLLVHVDRLNWDRSGTLILASKGDSSSTTNNWWKLTLQMAGNYSQLVFERNGYGANPPASGQQPQVQNGISTSSTFDVMPNGFNYDIVVSDKGTGATTPSNYLTDALSMYVNGLQVGGGTSTVLGSTFSNSYSTGFGYVETVVGTAGTGYANPTSFTSTGGGTHCVVAGTISASSGALQNSGISYTANYGCASLPTIVLTAPTGTGASVTATALGGASMNASSLPLLIPGQVYSGAYQGISQGDSSQTTTYVDEAAIFPSALNQTQIGGLFYQTKFHQGMLSTPPANPGPFIFDDDGCEDTDNIYALAITLAAHRFRYFNLVGVVNTDGSTTAQQMYRQMLDQAGLNNIPIGVPSTFPGNSGTAQCGTTPINTYNASTPVPTLQASTLYRTIYARYPTTAVNVIIAGSAQAYVDFLMSGADGISSLTGLQLDARNATNGGVIYLQGGPVCTATSPPATTPCTGTMSNDNIQNPYTAGQYFLANSTMKKLWFSGVPQSTGPGVLSTRTSKDPFYLMANYVGSDIRAGYDSLPMSALMTNYFYGGIIIGYSGGTGYANATPFTFTCAGVTQNGIMSASGGVPNGIEYQWGQALQTFYGIGYGCTSAPTITLVGATGTGVTLTSYLNSVCGTWTITSSTASSLTSASCSNEYFNPYSMFTQPPGNEAPIFTWFANSLIDPNPVPAPKFP